MKFKKGHEKKGGRKKGTPNKVNRDAKAIIESLLLELDKRIFEDIDLIPAKERVKLWIKLQDYVTPKMKAVELSSEGETEIRQIKFVVVDGDDSFGSGSPDDSQSSE